MTQANEIKEIRLQKAMADAGIASRRTAETMIEAGLVKVNDQVVTQLGTKIRPGVDRLEVEGKTILIHKAVEHVVYALHKPKGCVTTLDDPQERATVKDFFPKSKHRLYPVGRLDYDAEGLLLITNDGDFAYQISHPKFQVWKTYFVKIKGLIQPAELELLKKNREWDGKRHLPFDAHVLHKKFDKTWLEVSLREGTNQHIKKMFLSAGYRVLKIKRYRIGNITLGELAAGESRRLTKDEIETLLKKSSKAEIKRVNVTEAWLES